MACVTSREIRNQKNVFNAKKEKEEEEEAQSKVM